MRPILFLLTSVAVLLMPSAASAIDKPAYCAQQHALCVTLCTQVTQQGSSKRQACDGGCDQSVRGCVSSGSYNFAPVEQFMPEFT